MKSVKFYFSLLLSAVVLAVATPAMAQDVVVDDAAVVECCTECCAEEVVVADVVATHAGAGSEGRDNSDIDASFSVGKAVGDFIGHP